jgi:hypothetical protein
MLIRDMSSSDIRKFLEVIKTSILKDKNVIGIEMDHTQGTDRILCNFSLSVLPMDKNTLENFISFFENVLTKQTKKIGLLYDNFGYSEINGTQITLKSMDKLGILDISFVLHQRKEIAPLSDLKDRVKDLL